MSTVINATKNDFSDIPNAVMPWNILADNYGSDLATKQLQLEHEAYTEGEKRFIKQMERQIKAGEFADNTVAKPLMSTLVPKVAARVREWFAEVGSKGGHRPVSWKRLAKPDGTPVVSIDAIAVITTKVVLSALTKEENTNLQKVASTIGRSIEDEARFGRIRDEEQKHFKDRVAENLKKRVSIVNKKAFMSAVEVSMLEQKQLKSSWSPWKTEEVVHVGVRMLEALIESTGLVVLERLNAGNVKSDGEFIRLADEYVDVLTKRAGALAGVAPMFQPCVVPPKPWTGTEGGGYWAAGRKPLQLIRVGSRKALERYNDVYMPDVYSAVNTIQNTAWKINKKVLAVINEIIRWEECPVGKVPSMNPNKPTQVTEEEVADPILLKAWKRNASAIYRKEKARVSRRMSMEFMVEQANKFSAFKAIWFPYNMDWRGRVYAVSMFNPQGDDMTKGVLTLAKGKPIGEEGFYWLQIHGANCAGTLIEGTSTKTDKATFKQRLKWVADHHEEILACAKDPLGCTWWAKMDSPFCFLAFCFEYAGVAHHGLTYNCSLPLAFDGSCSGIQHFSAMLRDEIGGAAVNLIPSEVVQDIYSIVAEKVNERLREDAINGTPNAVEVVANKKTGEMTEVLKQGTLKLAEQWLAFGVTRDVTKRSVMTLAYGSKEYGFRDQVLGDTIMPAIDAGKGDMFTVNPNQAAGYMAKCIWDAVSATVVAAVEAMKWLQSAAKLLAAEVKDKKTKEVLRKSCAVHWTTPDGFPCWQEYRKRDFSRLNLMFLGEFRLQPTINTGKDIGLDAAKQESGIAPNFVHSQDGSHLRMTIKHAADAYGVESFAVIHDSFGTIPADAGNLFKAVRESMVNTYENNDVLADFYAQFADQLHESQLDKMPPLPAKGNLDIRAILKSDFAFA